MNLLKATSTNLVGFEIHVHYSNHAMISQTCVYALTTIVTWCYIPLMIPGDIMVLSELELFHSRACLVCDVLNKCEIRSKVTTLPTNH